MPTLTTPPTLAAVTDALRTLDWRQLRILDKRTLATHPATLQAIGDEIARTRERVRQLERDALRHLRDHLADDPHCNDLLAETRRLIDPAATITRLEQHVAGFADRAAPLDTSVGRLLLVLDGVNVDEQWAALPDLDQAITYTRSLLEQAANQHGALRLDDATALLPAMPPGDAAAWIAKTGAHVTDGLVLTRTRRQGDLVAGVLSMTGRPMTPEELLDQALSGKGSVRSLRNRMQEDERFTRTGKNHYALAEWGMGAYTTVVDAISAALDEAGGAARLTDLEAQLSARYGVTKSSVAAYAGDNFHFRVRNGVVTRTTQPIRKITRRARRVYRRPTAWVYRIEVTHDHARGSGFRLPDFVAAALRMRPRERRELTTPIGAVTIAWQRQVVCGSIRALLEHHGLQIGDQAFVVFGNSGTLDIDPVRGTTALELVGAGTLGARNPWPRVAAAIDLPADTAPVEVARALVLAGEGDVVAALPTTGIDLFDLHSAWTPAANRMLLQGATIAQTADALGLARHVLRRRLTPPAERRRRRAAEKAA